MPPDMHPLTSQHMPQTGGRFDLAQCQGLGVGTMPNSMICASGGVGRSDSSFRPGPTSVMRGSCSNRDWTRRYAAALRATRQRSTRESQKAVQTDAACRARAGKSNTCLQRSLTQPLRQNRTHPSLELRRELLGDGQRQGVAMAYMWSFMASQVCASCTCCLPIICWI